VVGLGVGLGIRLGLPLGEQLYQTYLPTCVRVPYVVELTTKISIRVCVGVGCYE